ncbi:MAG: c-type cytochrome [Acidimicrobiia bacterium]|nr:c-type cytochrome [Acidimicrobiia bacterium]
MSKAILGFVLCLSTASAQVDKEKEKVKLPTSKADLERGEKLYRGSCLFCHGPAGEGGKGANLARARLTRAANDEELVRIIELGIPGTEMPGAWHMTRREATQVAAYMRTFARAKRNVVSGDASRGKAIYDGKGGCVACHSVRLRSGDTVRVMGGLSGPDLSAIGARRSPSYLKEALLDPGATIPDGYQQVRVAARDGRTLTGILLAEDTFHILMRDDAGKPHSFAVADLTERALQPNRTLMPGYRDKFTAAELDDLVAYLTTLVEVN